MDFVREVLILEFFFFGMLAGFLGLFRELFVLFRSLGVFRSWFIFRWICLGEDGYGDIEFRVELEFFLFENFFDYWLIIFCIFFTW